jgi:hypothetical protein
MCSVIGASLGYNPAAELSILLMYKPNINLFIIFVVPGIVYTPADFTAWAL